MCDKKYNSKIQLSTVLFMLFNSSAVVPFWIDSRSQNAEKICKICLIACNFLFCCFDVIDIICCAIGGIDLGKAIRIISLMMLLTIRVTISMKIPAMKSVVSAIRKTFLHQSIPLWFLVWMATTIIMSLICIICPVCLILSKNMSTEALQVAYPVHPFELYCGNCSDYARIAVRIVFHPIRCQLLHVLPINVTSFFYAHACLQIRNYMEKNQRLLHSPCLFLKLKNVHKDVKSLVSLLDNVGSLILFESTIFGFCVIYNVIYLVLYPIEGVGTNWLYRISTWTMFINLTTGYLIATCSGAFVTEAWGELLDNATIYVDNYKDEMYVLLMKNGNDVKLTVWKISSLTRGFFFTILGSFWTYVLLVDGIIHSKK